MEKKYEKQMKLQTQFYEQNKNNTHRKMNQTELLYNKKLLKNVK